MGCLEPRQYLLHGLKGRTFVLLSAVNSKGHQTLQAYDFSRGLLTLNYERKAMKKYFNGTWKFGTAKLVHKYNKFATTYDSQDKTTFYNGKVVKHKHGQFKAIQYSFLPYVFIFVLY